MATSPSPWRWPEWITFSRPTPTWAKFVHTVNPEETDEKIHHVLRDYAKLPSDIRALNDTTDLFQAGMTSHASVNVMLALEDSFGIEFPERMLRRSNFQSIAAIRAAVTEITSTTIS
jgi:acyl carrier protein